MKKLMIVAAAVAVAGIAEAVPFAPSAGVIYDANFTLKTTVGKSTKDTQPYKLGWDGAKFWYEDSSLSNRIDATDLNDIKLKDTTNFTFKTVSGAKVPTLTKAGLENNTIMTNLVALSYIYNLQSAGKWCFEFKYTQTVCYRVAGTIKYAGYFYDDECLNTLINGAGGANSPLVNAFGAARLIDPTTWKVKSNKVEVYAEDISGSLFLLKADRTWGAVPVEILDNNKGARTFTVLSIAGHGTYGYVYDDTNNKVDYPGVTAVSGNVVGLASQPQCVSCCVPNTDALVWDCCNYVGAQPDTAVFGTFTIKYNNSLTKKELY